MTRRASRRHNEGMKQTRLALARHSPRLIDSPDAMSSAVLVPIYPHDGRYHVLLTKRSEQVEYHKGEISFPGGAEDPGDADLRFTALRETHEEIGVHPGHVEIIGQLDDFMTRTNFRIRPYVGLITRTPYEFEYDRIEVAEVLKVPVAHLHDRRNTREEPRLYGDGLWRTYVWGEHVIFGATAFILQHFLDLAEREGTIHELTGRIASAKA